MAVVNMLLFLQINVISATKVVSLSLKGRTLYLSRLSSSIVYFIWVWVRWGRIWVWDDGQAGLCMASVHGVVHVVYL